MHLLVVDYSSITFYFGCSEPLTLHTWTFFSLRTSTKVSEMLGNVNTSGALSAFEKMEEKGALFILSIFSDRNYLLC